MAIETVVMNFTGVYELENFDTEGSFSWVDLKGQEGVNCYCTPESEAHIKSLIKDYSSQGIHFLDSGNYHYVSKFWMEKIDRPFSLLLFDHHTDMQEAAFWGLLSCGSWVREVLLQNPMIKSVCIVGPGQEDFDHTDMDERVVYVTREELDRGSLETLYAFLESGREPLYVSVDKDILDPEDAAANWDQGNTSLVKLLSMMEEAFKKRECIGADICGENPQEGGFCESEDIRKNEKCNRALYEILVHTLENKR